MKLKNCVTNYLSLVSIRLDQQDSPHRIFESLNNAGMPLSASDLVRNHIFMRITNEGERPYGKESRGEPGILSI